MVLPNGYEMTTTFWEDFCIADCFGTAGIQGTFDNAFKHWKSDHVFLTELVIVLNLKIWYWYKKCGDCEFSRLYDKLWKQADAYALDHLKGKELDFFIQTTD